MMEESIFSDPINESLTKVVNEYLEIEKVVDHKRAIQALIDKNEYNELRKLFETRLQFGTAGIRGRMGPGYNQMNDLVVIQTAQGLASYLLEIDSELLKDKGVIVGHDARHNSHRFARLMALAFLQKGVNVYFNDYIVPTPFIAFGVRKYGCRAGIMVTASHNPKDDNGVKVYWKNGAQILSPHDKLIQEHISKAENLEPWRRAWDHHLLDQESPMEQLQNYPHEINSNTSALDSDLSHHFHKLFHRIYEDLSKEYFEYIKTLIPTEEQLTRNKTSLMNITFTPLHGVGRIFMERALGIGGFENIYVVENQKTPDPDFPTVKFPNPEESGALDEAFKTAINFGSNLILANDPDSDRCAAALYDAATASRRILNGNEIGALLGWWLWHSYTSLRDENCAGFETPKLPDPYNCYMISTAVSSKFLSSMAKIEGFNFVETLTGFKYMGNVTDQIINQRNGYVLFSYEEAIGYMVNSKIFDKDGISACLQIAQCAAYCSTAFHRTLEEQLDWLYHRYGYHYNLNSYYVCNDSLLIKKIFTQLQENYPNQFEGGYKVTRIRDLNNNYDSQTIDHKATLPSSASSYMVTLYVDHDITLTIRTSGTEPKIKYYSEIVAPLTEKGGFVEKEVAKKRLENLVKVAIKHCLKPDEYKLQHAL